MPTVNEVFRFLNELAPVYMKTESDNAGFLVGFSERKVSRILVSLDITDGVISEALQKNCDLLVSHHPLFFELKSVTDTDATGRKVVKLLNNGISAICMHTNLDAAEGGVNDALAEVLGLEKVQLLSCDGQHPDGRPYGIGRFGELAKATTMAEFLPFVKSALKSGGLRYYDAGVPVKRIAVVGGSGGRDFRNVLSKGCDTFVTADIRYDVFLSAMEEGLNLIDADHFCTENVVIEPLKNRLSAEFSNTAVEISKLGQTVRFI